MPKKPAIMERTPSKDEFHAVIDSEFGFLVKSHGFKKKMSTTNEFEIFYIHGRCKIQLNGSGYGSDVDLEISLDGRCVPWHFIAPNYRTRFTPKSDAPQLDLIRESAYRVREHLLSIVQGDDSLAIRAWQLAEQATEEAEQRRSKDPSSVFFSTADRLWKNKRWSELVLHLTGSSFSLSTAWQQRFKEAKTHTRQ